MRNILFSLLMGGLSTLASPAQAEAQGQTSGLLTRTVRVGSESYSYQVYVPAKLQGKAKLPVMLFLHGIGQRGEGGYLPAGGAAAALARGYLDQVPAIILLPQCREGVYWTDPEMERMVTAALDETVAEFDADDRRLYLTGVSMGGYGAWHMAMQSPEKFAAIVAICGGSPLRTGDRFDAVARRIGSVPVWVFHGEDDRVVPVSESRQMVAALKAAGSNQVRYSEYKGVGHNVWLNALKEKGLMSWLLAQRLD
jgi:predicted peptidase